MHGPQVLSSLSSQTKTVHRLVSFLLVVTIFNLKGQNLLIYKSYLLNLLHVKEKMISPCTYSTGGIWDVKTSKNVI